MKRSDFGGFVASFAMRSSSACGSACGAAKPEEKPSACGSACGAAEPKKEEKPSACCLWREVNVELLNC